MFGLAQVQVPHTALLQSNLNNLMNIYLGSGAPTKRARNFNGFALFILSAVADRLPAGPANRFRKRVQNINARMVGRSLCLKAARRLSLKKMVRAESAASRRYLLGIRTQNGVPACAGTTF
jgi:hypothetical protein